MAGVLSVDDTGVLQPYSKRAIAVDFLPRSEYNPGGGGGGGEPLPSYAAGATAEHTWLAPVYNPGAASIPLIRGGILAAMNAVDDFEIVIAADSKGEGFNAGGSGLRWRWGWPGQLRALLGAVEGTIVAFPAGIDARWAGTTMVQGAIRQPGIITGESAAQATFAFDTPHTGGSFWVNIAAGGSVTVTVDGGTAQSFTVPSGDGFHEVTPTVTGEGAHTYTLTAPAGSILYGFRPTYSGPRVKITNLGRSGMTAEGWMPGYVTGGTGHWEGMLAATEPDAIIGALGTNQGAGPEANAGFLTALWAQIAGLGLPSLIVTPGGLNLEGSESFIEQYVAQFNAADTHDFPLIDFASVIGTGAEAQARGLMADSTHENRKGFAYEAAAVWALIGVPAA